MARQFIFFVQYVQMTVKNDLVRQEMCLASLASVTSLGSSVKAPLAGIASRVLARVGEL